MNPKPPGPLKPNEIIQASALLGIQNGGGEESQKESLNNGTFQMLPY